MTYDYLRRIADENNHYNIRQTLCYVLNYWIFTNPIDFIKDISELLNYDIDTNMSWADYDKLKGGLKDEKETK